MKIAYVGPFAFPASDANSLRVKSMVEALVIAGHSVQVCAFTSTDLIDTFSNQVTVYHIDEYKQGLFAKVHTGLRGLFLGNNTLDRLKSLKEKPEVIILYGTHLGYLWRLIHFCKLHDIRLLLDVVEWYDPRHLPGGVFGPFTIANELSMRFFAKKADGMFVISKYLQEHFSSQGCKTFRVPPLFSIQSARPPQFREKNGRLNLCYVGSPGKKEDFISMFQGLQIAYEAGSLFTMHVVGITAAQFQQSYGMENLSVLREADYIQFYGRVDNSQAKEIVASCDFLVLLRKCERFVQAGFPSKVAESLCLGTPVMANLMSDLSEYLIEGENSIIVPELSANAVASIIGQAIKIEDDRLKVMKDRALSLSERQFNPQIYSSEMSEFIYHLCSDKPV